MGHVKRDCKLLKKEGSNQNKQQSHEANVADNSDGEVMFTSGFDMAFFTTADDCLSIGWIIDSGASFHVTPHRDWFIRYQSEASGIVYLGDDHPCQIKGCGDIRLKLEDGKQWMLRNVRHVPEIWKILVSVGQLDSIDCTTSFVGGAWKTSKGALITAKGRKTSSLYTLFATAKIGEVGVIDAKD